MDVLNRIDELRRERNWSINNLAMEAGLTQSTLNNLYSRRTEPKLSTLRSICTAFDISLAEFFAESSRKGLHAYQTEEEEIVKRVKQLDKAQRQALLVLLRAIG